MEKLEIAKYVLCKFYVVMDQNGIVYDMILRQWALKASKYWITWFKREKGDLQTMVTNFVNSVKSYIETCGAEDMYNADESEFNSDLASDHIKLQKRKSYRMHSAICGISSTGKLIPPVVILTPNTKVDLSSGKLISEIFKMWFTEQYLSRVPGATPTTVLLNSWGGHCLANLQISVPADKPTTLLTISKKTIELAQPLDMYDFRVWKRFVKPFSDKVLFENIHINLHQGNIVIKLLFLVRHLPSVKYRHLFLYSRYKSGYIEDKPDKFDHPVTFAFDNNGIQYMDSIFVQSTFIRRAHCAQYLCFQHFF